MKRALAVLMVLLTPTARRWVATRLLGWDVHPTAYLGRSLVLVPKVSLGPRASIGPWNVVRDIEELRMGEGSEIASRNWISGFPLSTDHFPDSPDRYPSLELEAFARITVGHVVDCSDRVTLRLHAALAGFRSQVLTHSLNLVTDRQTAAPVELGAHSAVMSGCMLLSGTRVPARSIVSAGSVVTTRLTKEQTFYRGNPAEAVRELPGNLGYFRRRGPVS